MWYVWLRTIFRKKMALFEGGRSTLQRQTKAKIFGLSLNVRGYEWKWETFWLARNRVNWTGIVRGDRRPINRDRQHAERSIKFDDDWKCKIKMDGQLKINYFKVNIFHINYFSLESKYTCTPVTVEKCSATNKCVCGSNVK